MDTDIFEAIIIDHSQRPRNRGTLVDSHATAEGNNPDTGDWVKIELTLEEGKVTAIAFEAKGSAVLMASCSLMTVYAHHKSSVTILDGIEQFLLFFEDPNMSLETLEAMGDVVALSGIRRFPARVKCASLPWRTLRQALGGDSLI